VESTDFLVFFSFYEKQVGGCFSYRMTGKAFYPQISQIPQIKDGAFGPWISEILWFSRGAGLDAFALQPEKRGNLFKKAGISIKARSKAANDKESFANQGILEYLGSCNPPLSILC